ncbi:MAG TPA: hypothetical protein DEP69_02015 [Acidimicrobiaceae bacterium]|nr:hypothetical protein [Acidimicrobiaceae bacterium]
MPAYAWARRRRRRLRAGDDTRAGVQARWADLCETLRPFGSRRLTGESHTEFALRAARRDRFDRATALAVARSMDEACYAPHAPTAAALDELAGRVRALERVLRSQGSAWERLGRVYRPGAAR